VDNSGARGGWVGPLKQIVKVTSQLKKFDKCYRGKNERIASTALLDEGFNEVPEIGFSTAI
jgi:hypothetical protein